MLMQCEGTQNLVFSEINKPQELSNPIVIVDHPYSGVVVADKSTIWTTLECCTLHENDMHVIMNHSKLTDKHIQFAQCLIQQQFPLVGSLCSTLQ